MVSCRTAERDGRRCGLLSATNKRSKLAKHTRASCWLVTKNNRRSEPVSPLHVLFWRMNDFEVRQCGEDASPCLVSNNRLYLPMDNMCRGTFGSIYADRRMCVKYLPTNGGSSTRGQLLMELILSRILILVDGVRNVVTPTDVCKSESGIAIVMPLAQADLYQVMYGRLRGADQYSSMSLRSEWARDIVRGVLHLHRRVGVLHMDIKPPNVVLRATEHGSCRATAYLIDFGLSEFSADGRGLRLTGDESHVLQLTLTKRGHRDSPLVSRRLTSTRGLDSLISEMDRTARDIGAVFPEKILHTLVSGVGSGTGKQSARALMGRYELTLSLLPPVQAHHYQTSWYRHPRQFDEHREVRTVLRSRGVEGRLRRLDELSDYWAVMVIIYELLTRRKTPLFSAGAGESRTVDEATAQALVSFFDRECPQDSARCPELACEALRLMRDPEFLRMGDADVDTISRLIQRTFLPGENVCSARFDSREVERLRFMGRLLSEGKLDPTLIAW